MTPTRTMTPDEILERTQWDFFWIPDEAQVVDRPEILYVSHPDKDRPLLNAVTRTRAGPGRLPALVAEVTRAHAGRTSRWLVPATVETAPLERTLAAAGYRPTYAHFAYALCPALYRPRPESGVAVRQVATIEALRDWLGVAQLAFGGTWHRSEGELQRELAACTGPDRRVARFVAYDDEQPVSCGAINLFPALSFGFLWAGGTVPEARGRGAYSALVAARMAWARRAGLALAGLYARRDTSAPIVERQGFGRHGSMTYWDRAPASAPDRR